MDKKRVLLLSTHPLLSEGLHNLLGSVADLELIGPYDLNTFTLTGLAEHAPDVVLFAEQDENHALMNTLTLQILKDYPDLPVIHVGLSVNNVMRVYTSHTLPARRADLIETIRCLPASP